MKNPYLLSDEEDPQLKGDLTAGTSQQMAPAAAPPPVAPPAPPVLAAAPKPAMPAAAPAPVPAPAKLPGMPAGISPAEIEGYLGKQRASLDKFGPDRQMDLQNQLNARRDSLGYKVTDAGKGFADALMQGVAGAGNPGWQNQFEGQEERRGQEQMNTLKGAQEAQTKNTEAKMTLDRMDPNSVLSKTSQKTYGPLFQELGYPPGKLQGMSAANIDSALQLMTAYGGKKMEARIKEYDLEIERMRTMGVLSHQGAEERMAKDKNQQEALQDLSKMPWYSRILHPDISKAMQKQAGMEEPANHPEAGAAMKWAQENPTDPRAAQIIQRLGK